MKQMTRRFPFSGVYDVYEKQNMLEDCSRLKTQAMVGSNYMTY